MIFVGVFVCREESYFCNNFPQGEPQHSCLCVHVYLLVYAAIFLFFCFALSKPVSRKQKWRTLKRINQRKTKFNIFFALCCSLKKCFFFLFFSQSKLTKRKLTDCWYFVGCLKERRRKIITKTRKGIEKKLEREREIAKEKVKNFS